MEIVAHKEGRDLDVRQIVALHLRDGEERAVDQQRPAGVLDVIGVVRLGRGLSPPGTPDRKFATGSFTYVK